MRKKRGHFEKFVKAFGIIANYVSTNRSLGIIIAALNDNKMVGSRVYVGGLPYGTRERDLEKFFKGYGRTRDILIKNGYGFVEFEDYRDADDAVYELNGKELLGERSVWVFRVLISAMTTCNRINLFLFTSVLPSRVVVEPARGTARGSGGHRDRYNDRYDRRGGGGRYDR